MTWKLSWNKHQHYFSNHSYFIEKLIASAWASLQRYPINACRFRASATALCNAAFRHIFSSPAIHTLRLQDAGIVPAIKGNSSGSGSSFMGPAASQTSRQPLCRQRTVSGSPPRGSNSPGDLSFLLNENDNSGRGGWLHAWSRVRFGHRLWAFEDPRSGPPRNHAMFAPYKVT